MRKNDHKTVHKTYINTLGVPHCHIAMGILFILYWTELTLTSGTMTSGAQLFESVSTSPLFALFTCCWMSFEAVLAIGNEEFEFVVSED